MIGDEVVVESRNAYLWRSQKRLVVVVGRNVAFKVAKMREAIMEDQDEFLMRNSEHTDVGVETNNRAQLEDVGQNADLYVANQEANTNTQP